MKSALPVTKTIKKVLQFKIQKSTLKIACREVGSDITYTDYNEDVPEKPIKKQVVSHM